MKKEVAWIWHKIDEGINWVTFALYPTEIKYKEEK